MPTLIRVLIGACLESDVVVTNLGLQPVRQTAWRSSDCCSSWHLPQSLGGPKLATESSLTFCVTRDPVERALSQSRWVADRKGDTESQASVQRSLAALATTPLYQDCHWMPQIEYLRDCDYVLRFEHLAADFCRSVTGVLRSIHRCCCHRARARGGGRRGEGGHRPPLNDDCSHLVSSFRPCAVSGSPRSSSAAMTAISHSIKSPPRAPSPHTPMSPPMLGGSSPNITPTMRPLSPGTTRGFFK